MGWKSAATVSWRLHRLPKISIAAGLPGDSSWPTTAPEEGGGLFFGNRPEHNVRRSLSTAISHIRLPDQFVLLSDANSVLFTNEADLWLDVLEFEACASLSDLDGLRSAAALYRGDFLDGIYDNWIISERYRLESLYLEVLVHLMILYEASEEHHSDLGTALQILERDGLQEEASPVSDARLL